MVPDRKFIEELTGLSGEEAEITKIFKKFYPEGRIASLGDAMNLTKEIYFRWKKGERVPDFNLDADRGYAYTCWTQRNEAGKLDSLEAPNEMLQHFQQENDKEVTSMKINFIPSY